MPCLLPKTTTTTTTTANNNNDPLLLHGHHSIKKTCSCLEPLQIEHCGSENESSCATARTNSASLSLPSISTKDDSTVADNATTNTSHYHYHHHHPVNHHNDKTVAATKQPQSSCTTTSMSTTTTPTTTSMLQSHLVLATDTLAGLLLHYGVASPQAIRRANPGRCGIVSQDCRLALQAGDRLWIPIVVSSSSSSSSSSAAASLPLQDTTTPAYKTAAVLEQCRYLTLPQAESYLSRNHWNVTHAIQHAQAVRQQHEQQAARLEAEARQRKQDAVQVQRILLRQKQQQQKQQKQQSESTELTSLTAAGKNNNNHNLYLDQPADNDDDDQNSHPNKQQQKQQQQEPGCVGAFCSLVCLVAFEWIRHSIPFVQ